VPVAALGGGRLGPGAVVSVEADGPGRIIVRGIDDEFDEFVGGVAGVVAAGALEGLRDEWR